MRCRRVISAITVSVALFALSGSYALAQCPFHVLTYTPYSGLMRGQVTINGVPASPGDCLGAFDAEGNCVGAGPISVASGVASFSMQLYGDDPTTPEDEGMNAGESFILKLFDASEGDTLEFPQSFPCWSNTNGAPLSAPCGSSSQVYNFQKIASCPFDVFAFTPASGLMRGQVEICSLPASDADCIAAFDAEQICVGVANISVAGDITSFSMQIYGDDVTTPADEGISPGELFTLRLFDASENKILSYPGTFNCWSNTNGSPLPPPCGSTSQVYDFCANQPPTARCKNIQIPAAANCLGTATTALVNDGSSDPEDGTSLTLVLSPAGPYALGPNSVKLIATDSQGSSDTCAATITVVDLTKPTVSCNVTHPLADVNLDCQFLLNVPASFYTVSDNCTPSGLIGVSLNPPIGTLLAIGDHTIWVIGTDQAENKDSCSFTLTVRDIAPPIVNCPGNITARTSPSGCDTTIIFTGARAATATDNCSGIGAIVYTAPGITISGNPASGTFPLGTTTVTAKVTDGSGNSDSCTFTVTVQDKVKPLVTCSGNISQANDPGQCGAVVSYLATASDNCELQWFVTFPASGTLFPVGITPVKGVATDAAGNKDSCTFTVTVQDTTKPTISCPSDISVSTDAGQCTAVVYFGPFVTSDNCPGSIGVVAGPPSGTAFPKGNNLVTVTATDAHGNQRTCTFHVFVSDSEKPTVSCPETVFVTVPPGVTAGVATYTPTATDNCPGVALAVTPPSGSTFPLGISDVKAVAVDAAGNKDSCMFLVNVAGSMPGQICGIVHDQAGTSLGFATVQLWDSYPTGSILDSAVTGPDGHFCFDDLPDTGPFDLRIFLTGYCTRIMSGVGPTGAVEINVVLDKLPAVITTPYVAWYWSENATISGIPLMPGDVITAVDPNGIVCGKTVVTHFGEYNIYVMGDDPTTPGADEGAVRGDQIILFLNCSCAQLVPGTWAPTTSGTQFDANFDCSQNTVDIPLCDPWTLFSFSVTPANPSPASVLSSVAGEYLIVLTSTCVYGPLTWDANRPFNDLTAMDPFHGFWLKTKAPGVGPIAISGVPVPVSTPLDLCAGWNLISYLPGVPDTLSHALSSIGGQYTHVFGFECGKGYVSWDANRPAFLNDLTCMRPLLGYWLKATQATTLAYPAAGYTCNEAGPSLSKPINLLTHVTQTPWVADFWSVAKTSKSGLMAGDILTVKSSTGVICGECIVGADGAFLVHVYGDDLTTAGRIEGAVKGDVLQFEVNGAPAYVSTGTAVWTERESRQLTLASGKSSPVPSDYALLQNYPNPFNPSTIIRLRLPATTDAKLTIYNALGQMVRVLFNGNLSAGEYSYEWNGQNDNGQSVQSGIYFYLLETPSWSDSKKMTFLK